MGFKAVWGWDEAVSGPLREIGGLGDRSESLGYYGGELRGPFGSLGLGKGLGGLSVTLDCWGRGALGLLCEFGGEAW